MKKYIYTDIACENTEGRDTVTDRLSDRLMKIKVSEKDGENTHHTVFFTPRLWDLDDNEFLLLRNEIASEVKGYVLKSTARLSLNDISVLVVGLGNPHITSDALGPETVKGITVTRHTGIHGGASICAIAPDIMGNTGIETAQAVRAYVELVCPSVVIAVDSLLAKGYERLASTVQISNRGITPGGGVGTGSGYLGRTSLGVPVISIGVPMAVNSSTLVAQAMEKGGMVDIPSGIRELLDNGLNFLVTPKEADIVLRSAALLLSSAIDMSLLGGDGS